MAGYVLPIDDAEWQSSSDEIAFVHPTFLTHETQFYSFNMLFHAFSA
jgi:hypothetical protein